MSRISARAASHCICGRPKGPDHVACSRCWFMVPNPLRVRIWQLFRSERGGEDHIRAVKAAVDWLAIEHSVIARGRAAIDASKEVRERVDRETATARAQQRQIFNKGMAASASAKQKCPVHGIPDCSPLLNGCSWKPQGAPCS